MRGSLSRTRIDSTVGRERFGDRQEVLSGEIYGTPDGDVMVTAYDKDTVVLDYEGKGPNGPVSMSWRFSSGARGFLGDRVGTTADGRVWGSKSSGQSWVRVDDEDLDTALVPAELANAGMDAIQVGKVMKDLWDAAGRFVEDHPERMAAGSLFEAANGLRRMEIIRKAEADRLAEIDRKIAEANELVEALAGEVETMANETATAP